MMSLAKPTFALVLVLGLSACAMEVASGEGPAHEPGTSQQKGAADVLLKGDSHAQDTPTTAPSGAAATGSPIGSKAKGDPAGIMDRPQPEPWDPTATPGIPTH